MKTTQGAAGAEAIRKNLFSTEERSGSKHVWACWMLGDVPPHPPGAADCTAASALASPYCPRPLDGTPSVALVALPWETFSRPSTPTGRS